MASSLAMVRPSSAGTVDPRRCREPRHFPLEFIQRGDRDTSGQGTRRTEEVHRRAEARRSMPNSSRASLSRSHLSFPAACLDNALGCMWVCTAFLNRRNRSPLCKTKNRKSLDRSLLAAIKRDGPRAHCPFLRNLSRSLSRPNQRLQTKVVK